jgi:hypothetical protein
MTIEHEAFQKLTDSLQRARSAATEIAALRQDQRTDWEQIAVLIGQVNDKVLDFAMRGIH